ncbi:MAG: hypothetical protein JRH11_19370 [Deltaproteobacteria bacterium]|nr:hypothetical protein [Deltaproteobacteria bacterium]
MSELSGQPVFARRLLIAALAVAVSVGVGGCGNEGVITIDGRGDGGEPPPGDASVGDGGVDSSRPDTDGGCTEAPERSPWVPADTGGPAGESLSACIGRVGSLTDDRLPVTQDYDITTFGGPGDEQPVSCASPDADGTWYYAANAQRFTCGKRIRVVDTARSRCVIVEVADIGPNACVEEAGAMPIFDVSPLASQALFDVDSVGWSEHRAVYAAPVDNDNALGPCDHHDALSVPLRGFIGGACASAAECAFTSGTCLTDAVGYPEGMCTRPCDTRCPDAVGPNAYTACHRFPDGANRCVAQCDFTLFANGCRDGYGCFDSAGLNGGPARQVCMPVTCP